MKIGRWLSHSRLGTNLLCHERGIDPRSHWELSGNGLRHFGEAVQAGPSSRGRTAALLQPWDNYIGRCKTARNPETDRRNHEADLGTRRKPPKDRSTVRR